MDPLFCNEYSRHPNGNLSINWVQEANLDWQYNIQQSTHQNEVDHQLLWPMPQCFTYDGIMCCICLNPFGPNGGWALETCPHMFHPPCLITQMHMKHQCPTCKAPSHQRLYQLFNLVASMLESWESNPTNTSTHLEMGFRSTFKLVD